MKNEETVRKIPWFPVIKAPVSKAALCMGISFNPLKYRIKMQCHRIEVRYRENIGTIGLVLAFLVFD